MVTLKLFVYSHYVVKFTATLSSLEGAGLLTVEYMLKTILCYFMFLPLGANGTKTLVISHPLIDPTLFHYTSTNVLRTAYASLGYDLLFIPLPARRSLIWANNGFSDGEMARVTGLEDYFPGLLRVPVPIAQEKVIVIANEEFSKPIKTWKELDRYKVGIIRGFHKAELEIDNSRLFQLDSRKQLFKLLSVKRLDAVVGIASALCDKNKLRQLKLKQVGNLGGIYFFHYINNKHIALFKPLTEVLQRMNKRGQMTVHQKEAENTLSENC